VLERQDTPFRLLSVSRPVPGLGQVLVRIAASAVNPLDIKIRADAAEHAHGETSF
jgi:NADPH:quinone reductase-like Zn-dependent oxidoreductase